MSGKITVNTVLAEVIAKTICSKYAGLCLRLEILSKIERGDRFRHIMAKNPSCFRSVILHACDNNLPCIEYLVKEMVYSAISHINSDADSVDIDVRELARILIERPEQFWDSFSQAVGDD